MAEAAESIIPINIPSRTSEGHKSIVSAVEVFHDGRRMVTGSTDKTLRGTGRMHCVEENQVEEHCNWMLAMAVSGDGQMIGSGGKKGELIAWHGNTVESIAQSIMQNPLQKDLFVGLFSRWRSAGDWFMGHNNEGVERKSVADARKSNRLRCKSQYPLNARTRECIASSQHSRQRSNLLTHVEFRVSPPCYVGYELKHAALDRVQRYDEAIATFEVTLSSCIESSYS